MFAVRLKELRIYKGWSQKYLAAQLQISKQNVSDWENEKSETSFEMLLKIAKLFGVTTDYLLGAEDY